MTDEVVPVYAGIVVSDVAVSAEWYASLLPCTVDEHGDGWSCLVFPDSSTIELFGGDPRRAGETFPSYGGEPGPPVMPGYAVEDPDVTVEGLRVTRSLPDWHVVVAPDGLRVVVTQRETRGELGLAGFRFGTPEVSEQRAFLDGLGVTDDVVWSPQPAVVPVVVAERAGQITDPDGTTIELVSVEDPAQR